MLTLSHKSSVSNLKLRPMNSIIFFKRIDTLGGFIIQSFKRLTCDVGLKDLWQVRNKLRNASVHSLKMMILAYKIGNFFKILNSRN